MLVLIYVCLIVGYNCALRHGIICLLNVCYSMFVEVLMHVLLKNVISSQNFAIHGCFTFTGSLCNHIAKSIRFSLSWKIHFFFQGVWPKICLGDSRCKKSTVNMKQKSVLLLGSKIVYRKLLNKLDTQTIVEFCV